MDRDSINGGLHRVLSFARTDTTRRVGYRMLLPVAAIAVLGAAVQVAGASASVRAGSVTSAVQVGFKAQSYAGLGVEDYGGAATGQKPESKLWFHDGSWWAVMVNPTSAGDHTIYRLQGTTWVDTGTLVDTRASTKEDVLDAGAKLYVVSRAAASIVGGSQLRRYTYAAGSYTLDAGFPVAIPGTGAETTTIARDTTGTLWITYTKSNTTFVAHSLGVDTAWGTPITIGTGLDPDDISAIISFTDSTGPSVGVMWSNQVDQKQHFAVHRDGAAETAWTQETASAGSLEADDHINLKTFEGRVFAAVKTEKTGAADPLIKLLARSPNGTWTGVPVTRVDEMNTRPITLLTIDPANRRIYVFMTIGEGATARGISYKESPIDGLGFPNPATVFIQGANAEVINDATSTKQNLTAQSGIVVMASDHNSYWWNKIDFGAAPPPANTAPTATAVSASTLQDTAVSVTLRGSDTETCELAFEIVTAPAHGTLGASGSAACIAGAPNRDTAPVTYTPAAGYTGADSFTYRVSDGTTGSPDATVSLNVTAAPPSSTAIAFRSASRAGNTGQTTLVLPRPAGTAAGDVLLASVGVRGSPAVTAPAGWTLVRADQSGFTVKQAIYIRVATATEPASYTWQFATSQAASGGILAFTGVDTAAPVNVSGGRANAVSTSITAPGVTTTVANTMLVGFFSTATSTTVAPAAAMTERFDGASTTTNYRVTAEGATQPLGAAGATGNRVANAAASAANVGQLVALKPPTPTAPPANTAPTATAVSVSTSQDTPVSVTLRGSDTQTCELTFSIASAPAHGTLGAIGAAPCTAGSPNNDTAPVTYTPAAGYSGSDSFTYVVGDGSLSSSAATVNVTISATATNAAPTAAAVSATTLQDTATTVTLRGSDAETCELTFTVLSVPAHGTLGTLGAAPCAAGTPNNDAAPLTYTPAAGYTGSDSFTYRVSDGAAVSAEATVTITVDAPPPPPPPPPAGGIAVRSASGAGNATATSLVLPLPAGVAAGDVLLASLSVRGSPTFVAPAGWTLVRTDVTGFTVKQSIYVRVAGSAEPASYTWTWGGAQGASGGIVAFTGVNTAAPLDASSGQVNASSTAITAPELTTTVANAMLVGFFTTTLATTIGPPSAMSERFDAATTAGTYRTTSESATQTLGAAGSTGPRTAVAPLSGQNIGALVALRPA